MTVMVEMRDGTRLATDLYLPPVRSAPAIALRTPYGRASENNVTVLTSFALQGYIAISQDVRGTGDSEPDNWDYYMYEPEDGYDLVEWIIRQEWFNGFLGACGGSYAGQTQWCMAAHPQMTTIVPEVSGLGFAVNTAHLYMVFNAYARSVGKGAGKVAVHYTELERLILRETLAGGYFNDPLHPQIPQALQARYPEIRAMPRFEAKRWLWRRYCTLSSAERAAFVKQALNSGSVSVLEVEALSALFGQHISHDAHTLPYADPSRLCGSMHAPALMITGWYDWGLNDALATWQTLRQEAPECVRSRCRLIIAPNAHNAPGYHEDSEHHVELQHNHRLENHVGLLLRWYATVREGTTRQWPTVIYYLMGANEWRSADEWPPQSTRPVIYYLGDNGRLSEDAPPSLSTPDCYVYDPNHPTPTVGGSIVSSVYPPGSVDVSEVQKRTDVLTFTTTVFERDFDVVGTMRLILYANSSASDTDFCARLSDVFPDGRAVQLQSGMLRARYRDLHGEPQRLELGQVYRLDIDMWATANRFKAGHRLRLDISSADFPRFDRNANLGGKDGAPMAATQAIYRDSSHPSHLLLNVFWAK